MHLPGDMQFIGYTVIFSYVTITHDFESMSMVGEPHRG